jgi:serine/threonine-protein kinase
MNQPRASRISRKSNPVSVWLDKLPLVGWQRKLLFYAGIPLLILLVLYLIADDIVMPTVTRHGEEFELPSFTGKTLVEAKLDLDDLELTYDVASEEYSPGVPKGIILSQFPNSGTQVKGGRVIKFVLSLGQKSVPIPQLGGLSVRQAMLDLETAGLELGEIAWAFSDTLPERVVVFSYPPAGTEISLGSTVNLMVNRGRASTFTYMPRVIGLPITEAVKRLEEKHLKVGITTTRTDENYLPETVLEQSEPEGTELDVGTEIDLVISTTE